MTNSNSNSNKKSEENQRIVTAEILRSAYGFDYDDSDEEESDSDEEESDSDKEESDSDKEESDSDEEESDSDEEESDDEEGESDDEEGESDDEEEKSDDDEEEESDDDEEEESDDEDEESDYEEEESDYEEEESDYEEEESDYEEEESGFEEDGSDYGQEEQECDCGQQECDCGQQECDCRQQECNCGELECNCGELESDCEEIECDCEEIECDCEEIECDCGELESDYGEEEEESDYGEEEEESDYGGEGSNSKENGQEDQNAYYYHAVKIGDCIHNRYRIDRKLGCGEFSTVWQCSDQRSNKDVAVKIMKSSFSQIGLKEIDMLKCIKNSDINDPNRKKIVQLLDDFNIFGVNSIHFCLVFQVQQQDLAQYTENFVDYVIPIDNVKNIVKQVLQGLDYLHTKCNIIHTDIKQDNILISVCKKHRKLSIQIADLGNACSVQHNFTEGIQNRHYRCPEVILGAGFGTSADIWSVACLTFDLATGRYLFDPCSDDDYSKDEDHLASMIALLGEMPIDIALSGKYYHNFFTDEGELRHISNHKSKKLVDVLVYSKIFNWPVNEARDIADFLLPMLAFDPNNRASATDCIRHSWLELSK